MSSLINGWIKNKPTFSTQDVSSKKVLIKVKNWIAFYVALQVSVQLADIPSEKINGEIRLKLTFHS
jgi:hypothetical protein